MRAQRTCDLGRSRREEFSGVEEQMRLIGKETVSTWAKKG